MVNIFGMPRVFGQVLGQSGITSTPGELYQQLIASITPAGLILNMPLNETSGTTADDKSTQDNNGTYSNSNMVNGGAFLTGEPCPLFVPASSHVVTLPASFYSDFNIDECCVNIWFRVSAAGIWTDGAVHQLFDFQRDANNRVTIFKNTTNNQIIYRATAGGTAKNVTLTISDTGWNMATIRASKAADTMQAYINGAQTGATQTGLGTAAGAIIAALIGNFATNYWSGNEAYAAAWSGAGLLPSDGQIANLYDFLV